MSTESERESATTRLKSERRYWRRSDTPQAWWPWGLMPVAGLAVLFLFGALFMAPQIEAEVRDQVASRIDSAGVIATEVASNGQGVNIRAEAQDKDAIYLQALAKSTQCDTWAGQLTCPTLINVVVEQADTALMLTGEVPDLAENERILGDAWQQINVHAPDAARHCNEKFDDILRNATVRFQTGSALIDAGNEELLQRLAELAQDCPGELTIEGHTDSWGDAEMNKALSLARAAAVRDALAQLGVDADRVTATGLGAMQPIADNATSDGRARNRRIAITIDETG